MNDFAVRNTKINNAMPLPLCARKKKRKGKR